MQEKKIDVNQPSELCRSVHHLHCQQYINKGNISWIANGLLGMLAIGEALHFGQLSLEVKFTIADLGCRVCK